MLVCFMEFHFSSPEARSTQETLLSRDVRKQKAVLLFLKGEGHSRNSVLFLKSLIKR